MKNGIPVTSDAIVILKDLGWAVGKIAVTAPMGTPPKRKVQFIAFMSPTCTEEHTSEPAQGIYMNGQKAFDGIAEMVDEVRSILVDDALISPKP